MMKPFKVAWQWPGMLLVAALLIGILTRLVSLLGYTTVDVGSAPDQIRDAFVYMGMREGNFPLLGPSSSVGGYGLPPLYFYLVYPAAWLGFSPSWHVLPNGVFSFLSIPLLGWLIYRLFDTAPEQKRRWIAGLSSLWYSVLYGPIFISNFQWNPSPIPFFLFAFLLLYESQFSGTKSQNSEQQDQPAQQYQQLVIWALYGVTLAILVSCHSTTLFVMPVVYVGSIGFYIVRKRRWLGPLLSFVAAILALTPYWYGEILSRGANTKHILNVIRGADGEDAAVSPWGRLGRIVQNIFELGWQTYWVGMGDGLGLRVILVGVLVGAIALTAYHFRNLNSILIGQLLAVWGLYLLAASSYTGPYPLHYKLVLFFAPIVLMAVVLAYPLPLNWQRLSVQAVALGFIGLSMATNLTLDTTFLVSKLGPQRVMTVEDAFQVAQTLPTGATVCDARYRSKRERHHLLVYFNTFMLDTPLQLSENCQAGDYFIAPKRRYVFSPAADRWPNIIIARNQPEQIPAELFQETATALVYQLKARWSPTLCDSFLGDVLTNSQCPNLRF